MKLSIITINYNDAAGLKKTLDSVAMQHLPEGFELEHIIVDGGSTDGSVDVIREYEQQSSPMKEGAVMGRLWVSEPDNGIYNAMNKGIQIAMGTRVVDSFNRSEPLSRPMRESQRGSDYCEFLNAGDMLSGPNVIEAMWTALQKADYPDILYGNMRKIMRDGKTLHDRCGGTNNVTLNMFYRGCLNHSPAYIRTSLFDKFGMYDESLRICSDWKFYMQSIVLGGASVRYVDTSVTIFDMGGISETRKDILNEERNRLLQEMIPQGILKDYERYHFPMSQYDRLRKYHLWGVVYFVERVLFKLEKWHILR